MFNLSYRDIEDLLAERGIVGSYETIRSGCNKSGPAYAQTVKKYRITVNLSDPNYRLFPPGLILLIDN